MDMIKYEDFAKIDFRVGKIALVEDIPGKDKIYKLEVDLGDLGKKTLFAGLKLNYKKEELKGHYVIIINNLEPKRMGNLESQGMLLAAEGEGVIAVLVPDKEIKLGSKVF
jgi:methionyl-tRNA synthetase